MGIAPARTAKRGRHALRARATGVDLSSKLLSSFYDPKRRFQACTLGYALIIGVIVVHLSRSRVTRLAGALYPAFVLLAIVATGNHFLLDAIAGALVALVGLAVATAVSGRYERLVRQPALEVARRD